MKPNLPRLYLVLCTAIAYAICPFYWAYLLGRIAILRFQVWRMAGEDVSARRENAALHRLRSKEATC